MLPSTRLTLLVALCPLLLAIPGCGEAEADPGSPAASPGTAATTNVPVSLDPPAREQPVTAATGEFADLGNGVSVAVLARLQAPAGADSDVPKGQLAEAWRIRLHNDADGPRPFPYDLFAVEHGDQVRSVNVMGRAFSGYARSWFEEHRGEKLPRLETQLPRLLPGQTVDGWVIDDVPAEAASGEAALIVLSKPPLMSVNLADAVVKLPAAIDTDLDLPAPPLPDPTLAVGDAFRGGLATVTYTGVTSADPADTDRTMTDLRLALTIRNEGKEKLSLRGGERGPTNCLYVLDGAGRVYLPGPGSFRVQPGRLEQGEEATVEGEFRVPPSARDLRLVVDGQLGHRERRKESNEAMLDAPMGVWAIDLP